MRISTCMSQYLPEIAFEVVGEQTVNSLGLLAEKNIPGLCSFLDDEKFSCDIADNISMLFITSEMFDKIGRDERRGYCIVGAPRDTFFKLHNRMKQNREYIRESFDSRIDKTASVSPLAVVASKNVIIGKDVIIEPFVTVYENTVIEDNCILRSGARVGGAGFEEKRDGDTVFAVEHFGGTILKHDVEIQNNSCVDRAIYPWDNTVVGEYTKIDNLVHIGHAAKLGRCCMVVAQSGIGGRTKVGDNTWIGFGTTVRNGIVIGSDARVNMGSVVSAGVENGGSVTGNFAIPHEKFIQNLKRSLQ